MYAILTAVGIYTVVFMIDYINYRFNPATYQYVSRRTYILFILGQVTLLYYFWPYFKPFLQHAGAEIVLTAIFLAITLLFAHTLTREKLVVCRTSRSERCLTPSYVLVKGAEIVFQQLTYAVIAFSIVSYFGHSVWAYIAYLLILCIMHTPVVLSMNHEAAKHLTFGIVVMAIPLLYIYTQIGYFYPAIYLHGLLYVFLWLTFADWNGKSTMFHVEQNKTHAFVEKSG